MTCRNACSPAPAALFKLTPSDVQRLKDLREAGWTPIRIAAALGCSEQRVARAARYLIRTGQILKAPPGPKRAGEDCVYPSSPHERSDAVDRIDADDASAQELLRAHGVRYVDAPIAARLPFDFVRAHRNGSLVGRLVSVSGCGSPASMAADLGVV